jgi:hypothetical protein
MPGSDEEQLQLKLARQRRNRWGSGQSPRVPGDLDWEKHGFEPRWLGMESSDCAVAIEPGHFHNHGADERQRFLAGARHRGEVALVVNIIGHGTDDNPGSVLSSYDASVTVGDINTNVGGRRLPAGTRAERLCCIATSVDMLNQPDRRQIARASSVNAAATRSAGWASMPSS